MEISEKRNEKSTLNAAETLLEIKKRTSSIRHFNSHDEEDFHEETSRMNKSDREEQEGELEGGQDERLFEPKKAHERLNEQLSDEEYEEPIDFDHEEQEDGEQGADCLPSFISRSSNKNNKRNHIKEHSSYEDDEEQKVLEELQNSDEYDEGLCIIFPSFISKNCLRENSK
jgi:hypothetical protein